MTTPQDSSSSPAGAGDDARRYPDYASAIYQRSVEIQKRQQANERLQAKMQMKFDLLEKMNNEVAAREARGEDVSGLLERMAMAVENVAVQLDAPPSGYGFLREGVRHANNPAVRQALLRRLQQFSQPTEGHAAHGPGFANDYEYEVWRRMVETGAQQQIGSVGQAFDSEQARTRRLDKEANAREHGTANPNWTPIPGRWSAPGPMKSFDERHPNPGDFRTNRPLPQRTLSAPISSSFAPFAPRPVSSSVQGADARRKVELLDVLSQAKKAVQGGMPVVEAALRLPHLHEKLAGGHIPRDVAARIGSVLQLAKTNGIPMKKAQEQIDALIAVRAPGAAATLPTSEPPLPSFPVRSERMAALNSSAHAQRVRDKHIELAQKLGKSPELIAQVVGQPSDEQLDYMENKSNVAMVRAGAGGGKSQAQINRSIQQVADRKITPQDISFSSLTHNAIDVLRRRVEGSPSRPGMAALFPTWTRAQRDTQFRTMHSFAYQGLLNSWRDERGVVHAPAIESVEGGKWRGFTLSDGKGMPETFQDMEARRMSDRTARLESLLFKGQGMAGGVTTRVAPGWNIGKYANYIAESKLNVSGSERARRLESGAQHLASGDRAHPDAVFYLDSQQLLSERHIDLDDLLRLGGVAAHGGQAPQFRAFVGDEWQDAPDMMSRLAAAKLRAGGLASFSFDMGQQVLANAGKTSGLLRDIFGRAGASVAQHALTINYRATRLVNALGNARNMHLSQMGKEIAPLQVAHSEDIGEAPTFSVARSFSESHTALLNDWMGLVMGQTAGARIRENLDRNRPAFSGYGVAPREAPIIFTMSNEDAPRRKFLSTLEQWVAHNVGPEYVEAFKASGLMAPEGHQDFGNPELLHLMRLPTVQQIKGDEADYAFVDTTRGGKWEDADWQQQQMVAETRARKQVREYHVATEPQGSGPNTSFRYSGWNNAPRYIPEMDAEVPTWTAPVLPLFAENAYSGQQVDYSDMPGYMRDMVDTNAAARQSRELMSSEMGVSPAEHEALVELSRSMTALSPYYQEPVEGSPAIQSLDSSGGGGTHSEAGEFIGGAGQQRALGVADQQAMLGAMTSGGLATLSGPQDYGRGGDSLADAYESGVVGLLREGNTGLFSSLPPRLPGALATPNPLRAVQHLPGSLEELGAYTVPLIKNPRAGEKESWEHPDAFATRPTDVANEMETAFPHLMNDPFDFTKKEEVDPQAAYLRQTAGYRRTWGIIPSWEMPGNESKQREKAEAAQERIPQFIRFLLNPAYRVDGGDEERKRVLTPMSVTHNLIRLVQQAKRGVLKGRPYSTTWQHDPHKPLIGNGPTRHSIDYTLKDLVANSGEAYNPDEHEGMTPDRLLHALLIATRSQHQEDLPAILGNLGLNHDQSKNLAQDLSALASSIGTPTRAGAGKLLAADPYLDETIGRLAAKSDLWSMAAPDERKLRHLVKGALLAPEFLAEGTAHYFEGIPDDEKGDEAARLARKMGPNLYNDLIETARTIHKDTQGRYSHETRGNAAHFANGLKTLYGGEIPDHLTKVTPTREGMNPLGKRQRALLSHIFSRDGGGLRDFLSSGVQKSVATLPYALASLARGITTKERGFASGFSQVQSRTQPFATEMALLAERGILDPMGGGGATTVGTLKARLRDLLSPTGKQRGKIPVEHVEQMQRMSSQVGALHSTITSQGWQEQAGHTLSLIMRATTGKGAFGYDKEKGEQTRETAFNQFFGPFREGLTNGTRTVEGMSELASALSEATSHVQATGTLKRAHANRVLKALGHDIGNVGVPSHPLFGNMPPALQKAWGNPEESIPLADIARYFPNEEGPYGQRNVLAELTRVPLSRGGRYVFRGGETGFGDLTLGQQKQGMAAGLEGELQPWYGPRPEEFGLSKDVKTHRDYALLSSEEIRHHPQYKKGGANENDPLGPLFQLEVNHVEHEERKGRFGKWFKPHLVTKRYPVRADQLALPAGMGAGGAIPALPSPPPSGSLAMSPSPADFQEQAARMVQASREARGGGGVGHAEGIDLSQVRAQAKDRHIVNQFDPQMPEMPDWMEDSLSSLSPGMGEAPEDVEPPPNADEILAALSAPPPHSHPGIVQQTHQQQSGELPLPPGGIGTPSAEAAGEQPRTGAWSLKDAMASIWGGHPASGLKAPSAEQKAFMLSHDRFRMLKAGPGSGKTATMVGSQAALAERGILPSQTQALSYMRSGVAEYTDRLIGSPTKPGIQRFFPGDVDEHYKFNAPRTIHSLMWEIARHGSNPREGSFPMLERQGVRFSGNVLIDPGEVEMLGLSQSEALQKRARGSTPFLHGALGQQGISLDPKSLAEQMKFIGLAKSDRYGSGKNSYAALMQRGLDDLKKGNTGTQEARLALYEQARTAGGHLDASDLLYHGTEAIRNLKDPRELPKWLRNIQALFLDEAQDISPGAFEAVKGLTGLLGSSLTVGYDPMQQIIGESLGGFPASEVEGRYGQMARDLSGQTPQGHELTTNWRSDRGNIALTEAFVGQLRAGGHATSAPQLAKSGAALGTFPRFGLASSHPEMMRKMADAMHGDLGISIAQTVANYRAGQHPLTGSRVQPANMAAIFSRHQDRDLFMFEHAHRLQEEHGLSEQQAYDLTDKVFNRDIPKPETLAGMSPEQQESLRNTVNVRLPGGVRSHAYDLLYQDVSHVGKGGKEGWLRNMAIGNSRLKEGGQAHYFATNRPFLYKNQFEDYAAAPDSLHWDAKNALFLGNKRVKYSAENAYETFRGQRVPAGFGEVRDAQGTLVSGGPLEGHLQALRDSGVSQQEIARYVASGRGGSSSDGQGRNAPPPLASPPPSSLRAKPGAQGGMNFEDWFEAPSAPPPPPRIYKDNFSSSSPLSSGPLSITASQVAINIPANGAVQMNMGGGGGGTSGSMPIIPIHRGPSSTPASSLPPPPTGAGMPAFSRVPLPGGGLPAWAPQPGGSGGGGGGGGGGGYGGSFNNFGLNLGRDLARIGGEMAYLGQTMTQKSDSAAQEGGDYRHATMQIFSAHPSSVQGRPAGGGPLGIGMTPMTQKNASNGAGGYSTGGSTGDAGPWDFSNPHSYISRLYQQLPMYSDTQIAQTLQSYLAGTNQYLNTNTGNANADLLRMAAVANIDPAQLVGPTSSITGYVNSAMPASFNRNGQGSAQTSNQLSGMAFSALKGNLTQDNLLPYLSSLQQMLPVGNGLGQSGQQSLTDAGTFLQLALNGGISPTDLPAVASAYGQLGQIGSTPGLQGQYQLAQLNGEQSLTASPEYWQFQQQQQQEKQQIATYGVQSNILFGPTSGMMGSSLSAISQMGLSSLIPGDNSQGGRTLSLQSLQIDAQNAQINADKVGYQAQQFQLAQGQASFNFQQWYDTQQYGPIGATPQQTGRAAYFQFEGRQLAAGYNPLSADSASTFKPTGPVFGLQNEQFYAGIENQRALLTLSRSPLLSDAAYQQQLKYLNEQENFYVRGLQLQNEQRAFQKTWGQASLDMQAKQLQAAKQTLVDNILMAGYQKQILKLEQENLPAMVANLKEVQRQQVQQIQGQGPVNGGVVTPVSMVQQMAKRFNVGKGQSVQQHAAMLQMLRAMGFQPDQIAALLPLLSEASSGNINAIQQQLSSASDSGLNTSLDFLANGGSFLGQQGTASTANQNLQMGGTGEQWQSLINTNTNLNNTLQTLNTYLAPTAPLMKFLGSVSSALAPLATGVASLANILGTLTAFAGGAGGAMAGGAGGGMSGGRGGAGGMIEPSGMGMSVGRGVGGVIPLPGAGSAPPSSSTSISQEMNGDPNAAGKGWLQFFEEVVGLGQSRRARRASGWVAPSHYGIVSPQVNADFGQKMWYGAHQGVDFSESQGTPLDEFIGGQIVNTGWYPWGGEVDVQIPGGATERYLHLSQIGVSRGQKIKRGQRIGLTGGGTPQSGLGYWSHGAHSHVQYDWGNINKGIDPWVIWATMGDSNLSQYYADWATNPGSGAAGGTAGLFHQGGGGSRSGGGGGRSGMGGTAGLFHMAGGGIAMRPMVTTLAEPGTSPEAVIPLNKLDQVMRSYQQQSGTPPSSSSSLRGGQGTGGKQPVTINLSGVQFHAHLAGGTMSETEKDAFMADALQVLGIAIQQVVNTPSLS